MANENKGMTIVCREFLVLKMQTKNTCFATSGGRASVRQYLLALTMLVSVSVWAGDENGQFAALGTKSCGMYIDQRKAAAWPDTVSRAWIAGYLTAYNRLVPDTYNIIGNSDLESVTLWLENYCRAHPLNDLDDAMNRLVIELDPKRHRTAKEAGK